MINTLIGKENISHLTLQKLNERFAAADIDGKILNTETEVEKSALNTIETFKKVVTGDEMSVEEKYKPRYTIKPFAKFLWGSNNLPQLKLEDEDNGYYRRLYILPFDMQISKEADRNFEKKKILNQSAIDYLANISLREYLKIKDSKELANIKESNNIINEYKETNNSVSEFLDDEITIEEVFAHSNIIRNTIMYAKYIEWCKTNKKYIKKKSAFYRDVLSRNEYVECKSKGYDCFKNTNIKNEGLKEKPQQF